MTEHQEHSTPIEFPCDFIVKVMGKHNSDFEEAVSAIINSHFPNTPATNFSKRTSKDANYLALTITVHANNKPELDALYQDLTKAPEVVMAL